DLAARRLLGDRGAGLARPGRWERGRPHPLGPGAGAGLPALADGLSSPLRPARTPGGHPLLRSPALHLSRLRRQRRALRQRARSSGAARGHERGGPGPVAARRPQAPGPVRDLPGSPRADGRAGLRGPEGDLEHPRTRGSARRGTPPAGRAGAVGGGMERALRGAGVGRPEDGRAGPRDHRCAPALRLQRVPEYLQAAPRPVARRVLESLLLLLQGDAAGLLLLPDVRASLPRASGPAHARRDPRRRRAREPLLPHRVQRYVPADPRPGRAPPLAGGPLVLLPAAEPGHLRLHAARAAAAGRGGRGDPRPDADADPADRRGVDLLRPHRHLGGPEHRHLRAAGGVLHVPLRCSMSDGPRAIRLAAHALGLVALNVVLLATYRLIFVAWFARRAAWGEVPSVLLHGLRLDAALLGLELL